MIYVIGPKDKISWPYINTTSRSTNWSKGLSPFYLGPIKLYGNYVSKNMENAWQYSKVYPEHADENQNPTQAYFDWAINGWNDSRAQRYPMGKNTVKPLYSWWNGNKLSYVDARKHIYIPLYARAVVKTNAFKKLQELNQEQDLWLWDFDGYNHRKLGMTYEDVMNSTSMKMGHAFVLAMILDGFLQVSDLTIPF